MKKIILYFLAFIGTLAILFFISEWFTTTGTTMYGGGSPLPVPAGVGNPNYASGPIAMMRNQDQSNTNQAPEHVMRGMIIRNADIALQVDDINSAMEKITHLAESSGGYVVNSNLYQDNNIAGNTTANISIRVPAQGLNNALSTLKSLATHVVQESVTGEDITQQFVDLKSQLSNLQTAKEQLSKIMASATKTTYTSQAQRCQRRGGALLAWQAAAVLAAAAAQPAAAAVGFGTAWVPAFHWLLTLAG